jgi:hypothetical protein
MYVLVSSVGDSSDTWDSSWSIEAHSMSYLLKGRNDQTPRVTCVDDEHIDQLHKGVGYHAHDSTCARIKRSIMVSYPTWHVSGSYLVPVDLQLYDGRHCGTDSSMSCHAISM